MTIVCAPFALAILSASMTSGVSPECDTATNAVAASLSAAFMTITCELSLLSLGSPMRKNLYAASIAMKPELPSPTKMMRAACCSAAALRSITPSGSAAYV